MSLVAFFNSQIEIYVSIDWPKTPRSNDYSSSDLPSIEQEPLSLAVDLSLARLGRLSFKCVASCGVIDPTCIWEANETESCLVVRDEWLIIVPLKMEC